MRLRSVSTLLMGTMSFFMAGAAAEPQISGASSRRISPANQLVLGGSAAFSRDGQEPRGVRAPIAPFPRLTAPGADVAFRYLAFAAAHASRYREAAAYAEQALASDAGSLIGNDLTAFRQDAAAWRGLADQPAQTTELRGPSRLNIGGPPHGRIEVTVLAGGLSLLALVDTGAERTVVSASTARRLKLRPLPTILQDVGSSGVSNAVRLAMLGRVQLGSATVRHVPVEIADDGVMTFGPPGRAAPVDLILGYSVIRTLGSITVTAGQLTINGDEPRGRVVGALREDGFQPELESRIYGRRSKFLLDTGANVTILTMRFFEDHQRMFAGLQPRREQFAGVGGTSDRRTYALPRLRLTFARGAVMLKNVNVFSQPSQLDADGLDGNMGRDLWSGYRKVTLDFRRRRLVLD